MYPRLIVYASCVYPWTIVYVTPDYRLCIPGPPCLNSFSIVQGIPSPIVHISLVVDHREKGMVYGAYSIQLVGPSGRPVHSDTNSTSLGSIQPLCNYCTKTKLFTHISSDVCSQVLSYRAECTGASWRGRKCTNFETV